MRSSEDSGAWRAVVNLNDIKNHGARTYRRKVRNTKMIYMILKKEFPVPKT